MNRYWKLGLTSIILLGFFGAIVFYNLSGGESLRDQGIAENELMAMACAVTSVGALVTFVIKSRQKPDQG